MICVGNRYTLLLTLLVQDYLKCLLNIGNFRNSSNSAVKQELVYAGSERGKVFALEQMLNGGFEPPALVFLQSKERAGSLFVELQARCPKVPIRLISSDLTREACDKILEKFRSGEIWVLIATEMLGRGLDLPGVNLVVNFDLPNSIISYIHRVGRTGESLLFLEWLNPVKTFRASRSNWKSSNFLHV